jgi:hypothetical protein
MVKNNQFYRNYLGDIQIDTPNTARHFCRNCKTLYETSVDDKQRVTRSIVTSKIEYTEAIAIL